MPEFYQSPPELAHPYDSDRVLQSLLRRKFPAEQLRSELEPELRRFGSRVLDEVHAWGRDAEENPPRHVPYDPWGRRVDRIEVSRGWRELDRISAEEGLVAIGYERRHGPLSRIHQFAKLYLFGPSSAIYTCPLAMTDGAARAIELYGDRELRDRAFSRLTSRDPARFWTSGQWMTERSGGSDVSSTETVARRDPGSSTAFRLYGTKWFTSATTSQMTMTLAKIEGGEGLSLFYVELRDRDGAGDLRNIRVHRLKDKLGTRALPTAELTMEGTPASLVGGEGHGVRKIASLFNITRVYNSICAVGYMRRGIALAEDYARRRRAFGRLLSEHPLHQETLAALRAEHEGAFHLAFRLVELLGKEETGAATEAERAMLRILTPIGKLYTAKQSITVASEVLECFGGAGYVEDTGLPSLLRDCQVLSIWEGTTNVLSLDVLRAMTRENALPPLLTDISEKLAIVRAPELASSAQRVLAALEAVRAQSERMASDAPDRIQAGARSFAYSLARTYVAALLLDQAQWALEQEGDRASLASAIRWCGRRDLAPMFDGSAWIE